MFLRVLEHGVDLFLFDAGQQRLEGIDDVIGERFGHVLPAQRCDVEKVLRGLGQLRQHRFQIGHQHPEQVEPGAAHGLHLGLAAGFLDQHPGLVLVDVLVGAIGQSHDFADGMAVLALFEELADGFPGGGEFGVQFRFAAGGGQAAAETLVDEAGAAAGDVHHLAHQIGVDPLLEVLEVQIDVVDAGAELGGEVVAQVFRIQMIQIGAGLDEGAAGLGHLLAVDGEKTVAPHRRGQPEAAAVEHGRPEQGVEVGDVLADEVVQLGGAVGSPPGVEVGAGALAPVFEAGHVADGGVQPHVEVLAGCVRDLETEIGRVAADVPVLQAGLEPLAQLVGDFGLHVFALQSPLAQHGLELAEGEEEVLRFLLHRRGAGDHGDRVLEIGGRVGGATDLATVAVLIRRAAAGAFALDEAVRQEHLFHRIVGLLDDPGADVAAVLQAPVDGLGQFPVLRGMGGVIMIEVDVEIGEVPGVFLPGGGDQFLGCDPLALGPQHDGGAVGVVGADVDGLVALHLLEAHPYIGLDVLHQMPEVDRAVGVGQRAGDEDLAGFPGHCFNFLFCKELSPVAGDPPVGEAGRGRLSGRSEGGYSTPIRSWRGICVPLRSRNEYRTEILGYLPMHFAGESHG